MAADLAYLAKSARVKAPPLAGAPSGHAPVPVAAIHDRELEDLVRDVYRRDYMSFGFGAWKAPK